MSDSVESVRAPHDDADNPLKTPRLEKLRALRAKGIDPYPYHYEKTADAAGLQAGYAELPAEAEKPEDVVRIAGRIRAYRNSGMFIDLHDAGGKIQVFCHKDYADPATLELVGLLDIGDLIGVEGFIRRTKRGELTINVRHVVLLAKTLLPLPEKYHGLTDVEARYRQRYLDLIMSEESRETFRARSRIVERHPPPAGGARFPRGRDADAAPDPGRRLGQAVRDPSQHARHGPVPAHRAGAVPGSG